MCGAVQWSALEGAAGTFRGDVPLVLGGTILLLILLGIVLII